MAVFSQKNGTRRKSPLRTIREFALSIEHHEFVRDRKEGEFKSRGDASLVEDVRKMAFDGLFADGELLGDVLVPAASDDAGDAFKLACSQSLGLVRRDAGCVL